MHSDDEDEHDAFFVQTLVEEVDSADYATSKKPLFSMRGGEPLHESWDPRSRLREYVEPRGNPSQKGCVTLYLIRARLRLTSS